VTQDQKKARVEKALGALPGHVVYVPVDFATDELATALRKNGYDAARRTLFIWEGVTMYLSAQAVDDTLAFVAGSSGPRSSIIFNYVHLSELAGTGGSPEAVAAQEILEEWGETHLFGLDPGEVGDFLERRGFHDVENVSPEALTDAYPALSRRGLKVASHLSLVHATT
jgi:methyltransferase (TIGR00027 family)